MNTTENNKLIGDFMEWKTPSIEVIINNTKTTTFPNGFEFNDHLKYHSSWDWLMPVVDKILNTSLPLTMENLINQKRIEIFKNVSLFSSIDKVYNACIEFIKWYNEQK